LTANRSQGYKRLKFLLGGNLYELINFSIFVGHRNDLSFVPNTGKKKKIKIVIRCTKLYTLI